MKRFPGNDSRLDPFASREATTVIDHPTLHLASQSPRRAELLRSEGYTVTTEPPAIDDGELPLTGVSPEAIVMSLAYFKARQITGASYTEANHALIIGADTICVHGEKILGKPADESTARMMLKAFRDCEHRTLTGVCLIDFAEDQRILFFDESIVRIGSLSDQQIEDYLQSGQWKGKAGGYNLADRIEAGWPIECIGDPTTVMGMPAQKLREVINQRFDRPGLARQRRESVVC